MSDHNTTIMEDEEPAGSASRWANPDRVLGLSVVLLILLASVTLLSWTIRLRDSLTAVARAGGIVSTSPTDRSIAARLLRSLDIHPPEDVTGIDLDGREIDDTWLNHLSSYHRLTWLDLDGTPIDGSGLRVLRPMRELQTLGLESTSVDDAGLAHIASLRELRLLDLTDTRITNAGMVAMRNLNQLQMLGLDGTRIGDSGLEALRGHTELQVIDLADTDVTDDCLPILASMPKLREVYLARTHVTGDGVQQIHASLPEHCELFLEEVNQAVRLGANLLR